MTSMDGPQNYRCWVAWKVVSNQSEHCTHFRTRTNIWQTLNLDTLLQWRSTTTPCIIRHCTAVEYHGGNDIFAVISNYYQLLFLLEIAYLFIVIWLPRLSATGGRRVPLLYRWRVFILNLNFHLQHGNLGKLISSSRYVLMLRDDLSGNDRSCLFSATDSELLARPLHDRSHINHSQHMHRHI